MERRCARVASIDALRRPERGMRARGDQGRQDGRMEDSHGETAGTASRGSIFKGAGGNRIMEGDGRDGEWDRCEI